MARTQTTLTPQTVRKYRVIAFFPESSCEEYRFYLATSLAEALTMAERDDATRPVLLTDDPLYGIAPEDYAVAEAEGIAFNRADGLLL
jgi:hypothetical protein